MSVSVAVITGVGGVVGAAAARAFAPRSSKIVGVDNDMRASFFGAAASTQWAVHALREQLPNFTALDLDVRDVSGIESLFRHHGANITTVIHCAAQPSHDWAATDPHTDFTVNANGTLAMLEATRQYCPEATFIFCSTNKVYGDRPNALPLLKLGDRFELETDHPFAAHGIDESMSIDNCTHSIFGVSKAAADLLVQEYGRYFAMNTVALRGGCLTGPGHSGAQLHGFLAHLLRCAAVGEHYTIFGYDGLQVRDNLHANDLAAAFLAITETPTSGMAYNVGGGRFANCSMLEAIAMCESITGNKMNISYDETARIGDHRWWISDTRAMQRDFGGWKPTYDIYATLESMYAEGRTRWAS